ncbi:unnamed protein product [Miscanthus lutarioriparius]|uniref:Uncharacterized protein n=1 Tax=Miscanthus lutarioriparius TaxID=422564 RepID=A0A811MDR6_9POAL|nr:unnamed protein product [Miscanthus lutarioriparius]
MDSSSGRNKQRHPERTEHPPPRRSQSDKNSPSEALQIQATGGSNSNSNGSRSRGAEQPRSAPPAETTRTPTTKPSKTGAGVGAFGPVVGLSVVVAVSMAGLLGGWLWAVSCVCAWLAALSRSRLRRREAAGEVAVDVDSTDHEEPVVLRGLLERDRTKAVAA